MKHIFKDILDNDELFESIIDNLFEKVVNDTEAYQMVKGKNGVYYQKGKNPVNKTIKRITDTAKKHKKALIAGTAATALAGTGLYAYNKGKKNGIAKGKKQAFSTGL